MVFYHRMLLHRLADIFDLMHESVEEENYCHPWTMSGFILVSNILKWKFGKTHSPGVFHLHLITKFKISMWLLKTRRRVVSILLSESQLYFGYMIKEAVISAYTCWYKLGLRTQQYDGLLSPIWESNKYPFESFLGWVVSWLRSPTNYLGSWGISPSFWEPYKYPFFNRVLRL